MVKANCGGLILDGSTLKLVNGIITVSGGNPTNYITSNCGGIKFDATYFKKVGDVITDKKESSVEAMTVKQKGCGGLLLDAKHFTLTSGNLVFDKVDSEAKITSFKIGDVTGVITDTAIAVEVPYGTDVTQLKPTIVISKDATVSPKSGAKKDFTDPVTYTVTAEDGTTKTVYTVTVTVAEEVVEGN